MKNVQKIDLGLTGYDELFANDEERKVNKLPRIFDIPISEIDDFPDHPFKVKIDEDILVLPCKMQTRGWKHEDIDEYNRIMKAADKVVYTSQDYYNGCMHKRNRHLVDNSSRCICFLTEKTGGTFYTVNYASEHGLTIFNIAK